MRPTQQAMRDGKQTGKFLLGFAISIRPTWQFKIAIRNGMRARRRVVVHLLAFIVAIVEIIEGEKQ